MFFFHYYYILLLWVVFLCALSPIFLFPTTHSASAEYTLGNALKALYFAKASYCEQNEIVGWTCPACKSTLPLRDVNIFIGNQRQTQAFIGVNDENIVVGFRGTSNLANWIQNLNFCPKPYSNKDCVGCKVHSGFFDIFSSLRSQMLQHLLRLVAKHPKLPLLITGHSLGGALAVLAAADFASHSYPSGTAPHIELYTFGAPRVGNDAFANWFTSLFCKGGHNSYRITHNKDIVPHLPLHKMGYTHTPHELWFSTNYATHYKSCSDITTTAQCSNQRVKEDSSCSNSVVATSVEDHLLYLGVSTSCSSKPTRGNTRTSVLERVTPRIEELVKIDHDLITKNPPK